MNRTAQTVTRGLSRPKKEVGKYIGLANAVGDLKLLPPDKTFDSLVRAAAARGENMPDIGELRNAGASGIAETLEFWITVCREIRSNVPGGAKKFLGTPLDVYAFCRQYTTLCQACDLLPKIADTDWPAPRHPREASSHAEYKKLRAAQDGQEMGSVGAVLMNVLVSAERLIKLSRNQVLDVLVDVRADHIRRCAIDGCRRIFWAPRYTSSCCSEKCSATLRQRKRRATKTKQQSDSRINRAAERSLQEKNERIQQSISELIEAHKQPTDRRAKSMRKWVTDRLDSGFAEAELIDLGLTLRVIGKTGGMDWDVSMLLTPEGYGYARDRLLSLLS